MKMRSKPKKTRGNRISALHDHICQTSTAVIKYLPPAIRPRYDALGKRIKANDVNTNTKSTYDKRNESSDIMLLKSSIRHKTLCGNDLFVRGFVAATIQSESSSSDTIVCIDTIAHNYQIIDAFMTTTTASKFISQEKWYYILYNAIIHEQTSCKDILLV
jgi:hypothetical protein